MMSTWTCRWVAAMGGVILTSALALTGCGKPSSTQPLAGGPGKAAGNEVLTVYVPCGMELPFRAAQEAFQAAHPGVTVNVVLDNANVLVQRILEKGEKADLLASPGTVEMEVMEKAGAVKPGAVRPFGRFDLVLFAPRSNPAGIATMADLRKPAVKTIAMADPETNSVGRYTRQALQKAGLWDTLTAKMIFTDHPITAYKHVAREKAEASFAYRSCPLKTAPDKLEYSKVRILESVPLDSYDPAFACIAPLSDSPRAQEFIEFLLSADGQKLLGEHDIPVLPQLTLFVPCGMIGPFFNLRQDFRAAHPGVLVDLVFDRADALGERILGQGERPDLHFSIGEVEKDQLVAAGVVAKGNPVPFGTFRLALCAHRSKTGVVKELADLAKPEVKAILLTPTENTSVGAYARKALEHAGLWAAVKDKIVYRPTIKDCYKDLSAGAADAGFAYVGCPLPVDPEKAEYSKVVAVQVIPVESYGGATVYASVLAESRSPAEAKAFVTALRRPEARQALATVGIGPVSMQGSQ
jgi:molybdate transport system substrate-binding protein